MKTVSENTKLENRPTSYATLVHVNLLVHFILINVFFKVEICSLRTFVKFKFLKI